MAYCGDDDAAKAIAATLIRDVGFEPPPVENLSKTRAQRVEKLWAKKKYESDRAIFVAKLLHERRFVLHFACVHPADA